MTDLKKKQISKAPICGVDECKERFPTYEEWVEHCKLNHEVYWLEKILERKAEVEQK